MPNFQQQNAKLKINRPNFKKRPIIKKSDIQNYTQISLSLSVSLSPSLSQPELSKAYKASGHCIWSLSLSHSVSQPELSKANKACEILWPKDGA